MRVLVTGARGKVGQAAIEALTAAGHEVVGTDALAPDYDALARPRATPYIQADLCDPGDAFTVIRGCQAVVHCAALPTHRNNTPHRVFANNLLATFNVAEAAASFDVTRVVNLSSAAVGVPAEPLDDALPPYLPVDEAQDVRPQEPYALAKYFGEQVLDSLARRSGVRCISLRPCWAQRPGDYRGNLGPTPGPSAGPPRLSRWSYVDMGDLADAILLALGADLPGHEALYISAADNSTGRPLQSLVAETFGGRVPLREVSRPDASPISSDKARRLLGWIPRRTWRDYLEPDGGLR
jgi:UDP-glucose 4-epimerase